VANISLLKNSAKALTRSRLGFALFSGAKSLATSFSRIFYSLWLEFVGLLAAFFAFRSGVEVLKIYRSAGISGDPKKLWLTAAVALFCVWFSVSCFLKARRLSNRKAR
jgi:hypothetical protein